MLAPALVTLLTAMAVIAAVTGLAHAAPGAPADANARAAEDHGDPNLPRSVNSFTREVEWLWYNEDLPIVTIIDPQFTSGDSGSTTYLGWDEQGSYLVDITGQVLCYVLRLDSLLECYSSVRDIPPLVLKELHHPHVTGLLPQATRPPSSPAPVATPVPRTGPVSDSGVRAAVGQLSAHTATAPSGAMSGVAASSGTARATLNGSAAAQTSGSFAYVPKTDGTISAYHINTNNGELTPIPGSPFPAIRAPQSPVIVEGRFLYATDSGSILGYAVGIDGALKPLAGSPFPGKLAADGSTASLLAADHTGHFLFGVAPDEPGLLVLAIDQGTGALHSAPGSPYPLTGTLSASPSAIVADPRDPFVYVVSGSGLSVLAWRLDAASGALSQVPGSQFVVSIRGWIPMTMAIEPTGRFAYVAIQGGPGTVIAQYAIDRKTGALSMVGAPIPAAFLARRITVDPLGRFLYLPDAQLTAIIGFRIDPANGKLSVAPGSPYPADPTANGVILTVHPSGRFAYATGVNEVLVTYAIDPDTGALQFNGAVSTGSASITVAVADRSSAPPIVTASPVAQLVRSRNPESDPNFPNPMKPPTLPLRWTYQPGSTIPLIWFNGGYSAPSGRHARYLGFNEEGSWLEHPDDHRIFLWHFRPIGLEKRYTSFDEMPKSLLAKLKNAPTG